MLELSDKHFRAAGIKDASTISYKLSRNEWKNRKTQQRNRNYRKFGNYRTKKYKTVEIKEDLLDGLKSRMDMMRMESVNVNTY